MPAKAGDLFQSRAQRRTSLAIWLAFVAGSIACAQPGVTYLAMYVYFKSTTGFPPLHPSLVALDWIVWARDRGIMSLPFSVASAMLAAVAWFGKRRFVVFLAPALALLGTAIFWLDLFVNFRD